MQYLLSITVQIRDINFTVYKPDRICIGSACMRYRFDGTIFVYGFIYKRLFLFATANKLLFFCLFFEICYCFGVT